MRSSFSWTDWCVIASYALAVGFLGTLYSRRASATVRDYFLASGSVPAWLAAISVLATTQSAATFLGGPDYGYRGDFTYLSTGIGAFLAAVIVSQVLIPRFYARDSTTVYELLGQRFGAPAMRAAGLMFVVGRVLAGGARLYLAAAAISLILFGSVSGETTMWAAALLTLTCFLLAVRGGLRAIVWVDLLQFAVYAGAALAILLFLLSKIPVSPAEIVHRLAVAPHGPSKLGLLDLSLNVSHPFSLPAVIAGITLLYVGNYGLDQDTTQRLLACRDAKAGARGLYQSVLLTFPFVGLFIVIGTLLYVVYHRPDIMNGSILQPVPQGVAGKVTVLMYFILTQAPPGLRGLAVSGVLATTIGPTMSALNAMSSVLVQDFYRPWRSIRGVVAERHYILAGRIGMALTGLLTLAVAILSFYWQRYSNASLLEFVLSVMNFAYAGLLGIYFAAVFTGRGTNISAIAALGTGFLTILLLQPYLATQLGLSPFLSQLAFPWQLCLGTLIAFGTCLLGSARQPQSETKDLLGSINAH